MATTARAAAPITGLWVVQAGNAAVDIQPCGTKLCGAITWMKEPLNAQGKPKTDIHNPDPARQGDPVCGLKILYDFTQNSDGGWSGGKIYDAQHGDIYSSNMHVAADGTLALRGFVGLSLFGKTQTWTRPSGQLPHC